MKVYLCLVTVLLIMYIKNNKQGVQTLDGNRRGNASGKGALLFYQFTDQSRQPESIC